jgi:hypothetical protein
MTWLSAPRCTAMRERAMAASVVVVCVMLLSWRAGCWAQAKREAARAASALEQAAADVGELRHLLARKERAAVRSQPSQDLISRLNAALESVQIPADSLKGHTPEADVDAPALGSAARRQTVRASFRGWRLHALAAVADRAASRSAAA